MSNAETTAGPVSQTPVQKKGGLMLAFYGDDFTGSTDALEFLSRAGVRTVLFTDPPEPETLTRYPGLQAVGVAGMTRSMSPDKMEEELRPALKALNRLNVPHVHYKVCSTFDSSPGTGSIGKAMGIGAEVFSPEFIPLLVAAPALGRYCLFGNLFARLGTGSEGAVFRLDRHPSMSKHPVTPSDESDLRLHLSRQTKKRSGLLDILQLSRGKEEARQALEAMIRGGDEVILFDALHEDQLPGIGELIDAYADEGKTLFSVGSSGIEMALGAFWASQGIIQPVQRWISPGKAEPLLVLSGSCSPVTRKQISWALSNGFSEVVLDHRNADAATEHSQDGQPAPGGQLSAVVALLKAGRNVILHTGEPLAAQTGAAALQESAPSGPLSSGALSEAVRSPKAPLHFGTRLGRIAREAAAQVSLRRLVVAGGDTSSYAARELGIEAVEMIAPVAPGAPLCRAFAPASPADGMEVNFKGGQVGTEDYFGKIG